MFIIHIVYTQTHVYRKYDEIYDSYYYIAQNIHTGSRQSCTRFDLVEMLKCLRFRWAPPFKAYLQMNLPLSKSEQSQIRT